MYSILGALFLSLASELPTLGSLMDSHLRTYEEARDWLYALKNRGTTYGIERMEHFAKVLGVPHAEYPVIHVAGTNGKGSTCAMLEAVFRRHGFKTGLSTSPHLVRQGERIQVNREILHEDRILEYVRILAEKAEVAAKDDAELYPSFFEFMTGMAFMHFANRAVDIAIVEVGLGGRLDATNVVDPEVSVITSIALDHCEILGDTLAKIAAEKAGIIKVGKPVVIGLLEPEAERVIRDIAKERGCELYSVRDRFGSEVGDFPESNLSGDYQRVNAGMATLVCEVLQERFDLDQVKVTEVLKEVAWAGRWEERRLKNRTLVFDVSHNSEGAKWLDLNLERLVKREGSMVDIVMGVMGEYRAKALVPVAAKWARSITFVIPQQSRACSFDTLEKWIPASFQGDAKRGAIGEIFPGKGVCSLDTDETRPLVVTGSIYLIGEIWERFEDSGEVGQG
ncbi:MAG: folylpolyglutamate synthase/dihydrofolate synthase family protein, partial [Verrucomicrobiota bacterium]